MKTPQDQPGLAPSAPAPVASGKVMAGLRQPPDSAEVWNPKSRLGKLIVPIVTSWPVTCLWVSTAFLTICYVGGDFKNRKFDDLWNPALNPERWFKQEKIKSKAEKVNPVQASLAQTSSRRNH